MKKFFKWILLPLISLILLVVLSVVGVLFFKPTLIINNKNVTWVLNKTNFFESWSWNEFVFDHKYLGWNDRILHGHITDFCFKLISDPANVNTCMEEISWNFEVQWADGLKSKTIDPFKVRSSLFEVSLKDTPEEKQAPPPDIYGYWSKLWSDLTPDIDVYFKKIVIKDKTFDFKLIKKPSELEAVALGFTLKADPKQFTLYAPSPYEFPKNLPTDGPLYFRDVKLHGLVKSSGITLDLDGAIAPFVFIFDSKLKLPLKGDFNSLAVKKDFLLQTKGEITMKGVKASMQKLAPDPYKSLPAPLNEMDGDIRIKITTSDQDKNEVLIKALTNIDLQSKAQALIMDIGTSAPLNVDKFTFNTIFLDLEFKRVSLLLPRLSKKRVPPQFIPDSRIKKTLVKEPEPKKGPKLEILLEALNDKALHIKTDLLDEPLRLNLKLSLDENAIQDGFVSILPLKTKVFKRPISVQNLKVTFRRPAEPVIEATILFPLPEYKVTLTLEGPVSKPRYNFRSDPPLPQSDIYAVLLFGRPMSDLDSSDKGAAAKTNQVLSQGILSLSVLYFLAGSPVEYVGYDPASKNATAQFGLGKKTSLTVGGGQEGLNSTGLRRSLGKGWYIDTSVQNPGAKTSNDSSKNYGVLIERIIAY